MLGQGLPLQTCIGAGATNKAHKSYAAQHTRLGAAGPAKMQRLAGFMSHGSSGGLWQGCHRAWACRSQGLSRPLASTPQAVATGAWAGDTAPRVVVLGGGFGGLYAAVRLDQLMWPRGTKPQVTLIDRADRFVFKPLLYEVLNDTASEREVAPPFSQVLAPYPIQFVQAEVSRVEPSAAAAAAAPSADAAAQAGGHVVLSDGSSVEYDFLVVALGSEPDARGVPGVREHAVPFNTYDDALKVKGSLDALSARGSGGGVLVVGAGYSGVELAATMAERLKDSSVAVQLVTPGYDLLEGSPEGQQQAARQALGALGVQLITGMRVERIEGTPSLDVSAPEASTSADNTSSFSIDTACTVSLTSSSSDTPQQQQQQQQPYDLVVWTAGSAPATRAARQGFPFAITNKGALCTEPTLRLTGQDRVFALGDVSVTAVAPEGTLPATAQVAFQQADYVAWNVWASINGRALLPFRYQHLGSMMSLGALNGAVALPVTLPPPLVSTLTASPLGSLLDVAGIKIGRNDLDSNVTIEGPLAAALRRAAYLYRQPTNEQRLGVASNWLSQAAASAAEALSKPGASSRN